MLYIPYHAWCELCPIYSGNWHFQLISSMRWDCFIKLLLGKAAASRIPLIQKRMTEAWMERFRSPVRGAQPFHRG